MQLQDLFQLLDSFRISRDLIDVPPAVLLAIVALLIARFLPPLVARMVVAAVRTQYESEFSDSRSNTIHRFVTHLTRAAIFTLFAILILALFVDTSGLLTFLGLFTAAFGFGVRPLVSDYISGLIFLLEDQYNIGDEIEVASVKGTVLELSIRTTLLMSTSGEIYRIPNGEMRTVRNFARGDFSLATVRIHVPSKNLGSAIKILEQLVHNVEQQILVLLDKPEILADDGELGDSIVVTALAKTRAGEGPNAKRKLIEIIHAELISGAVIATG